MNFKSKWKDMVKKGTPIPTPRTSKYKNTLGAYEGGGYTSKGVYSPMQDCRIDRKSTRLNSSHTMISYAVFCLKKKKIIY